MVLGGFWHNANWTFVIWSSLHDFYLVVNHLWHALRGRFGRGPESSTALERRLGQAITFVAVVIAWVFFRSEDVGSAVQMLLAMAGNNGAARPESVDSAAALVVSTALLAIAWFAPNTQELTGYEGPEGAHAATEPRRRPPFRWQPSTGWAVADAPPSPHRLPPDPRSPSILGCSARTRRSPRAPSRQ